MWNENRVVASRNILKMFNAKIVNLAVRMEEEKSPIEIEGKITVEKERKWLKKEYDLVYTVQCRVTR